MAQPMEIDGGSGWKGKGKAPVDASEQRAQPWVEKYRPSTLDDVISHTDIVQTVRRLATSDKLPHLLFYGPPGTGKTTTILACARMMFGKDMRRMVLELNASDDRGIDVVRQQITDFVSTRVFTKGTKIVILDEADAMTSAAQMALRRVIEKYTKNARFCIICNYVGKIIPALQSRCMRFRFAPLESSQVTSRLHDVAKAENVSITEDAIKAILRLAKGDMRKCLNIMQSTHLSFGKVEEESVYSCTGDPLPSDIKNVCEWLLNEKFAVCFGNIQTLQRDRGVAISDLVAEVHRYVVAMKLPSDALVLLMERLGAIEHRLAQGASEKVQLGALVGAFVEARALIGAAA